MVALGLKLDFEAERIFVQKVEEGRLDGLCVNEVLDQFGLLYESTEKNHIFVLRRNRFMYLLWRLLGSDRYIIVFAKADGDMVEGVLNVFRFPSMTPLYPRH